VRIALPGPIETTTGLRVAEYLAQQFSVLSLQATIVNNPENGLPSVDLIIANIIEKLNGTGLAPSSLQGFVLSNFPASITQAQALDVALANIGQPLSCVVMPSLDAIAQHADTRSQHKMLSRYYRAQNKLIFIDNWNHLIPTGSDSPNDVNNLSEIYGKIRHIYEKRRIR
jgi:hypothetical protein